MAKAKSIKNPQKAKSPSHTPLKIVQAVHAFPPAIGGLETHVYNLSLEIAKQGHKVIIHTSNQKDSKEIDEQLKQKGIIVKRHFAIQFPIFSSVKLIPTMCLSLLREKADIYHSHGYGAIVPIQTSIISFIKRKKFIWAIHGIPKFRGIKSIFPKLYSIPALLPLKIANKIICVSDSAKEQLPKFAQNKSEIIPNGLSEIFFTNSPEHKKHGCAHEHFKILFVGRLDKSKGIFMLADAFKKFKKNHDACLSYNGPDESNNKEKLLQFAKENNFCIEFSHLPMDEMPQVYKSANVTVLPSEYEGFGLSIIESWASGTPAISTKVGIAQTFFKDAFSQEANNFLFHDEHSLISSLEFIHSLSPSQIESYRKKAKEALKEYKWEKVAKKTIEIYTS